MKITRNLAAAFLTAVLALSAGALPAKAEEQTESTTAAVTDAEEQPSETEPTEAVTEPTEMTGQETTAPTAEGGSWQMQGGKRYYYLADGEPARGELVIDGVPYLFGYSGAQKTDWQTVGGKRYYYDPKTGEAAFGWFTYFEKRYYISEDLGKLTGLQELDGKRYRFSEDGALQTGYFTAEDGRRGYAEADGTVSDGMHGCPEGTLLTDAEGIILKEASDFPTETVTETQTESQTETQPEETETASAIFEKDGEKYYIAPNTGVAAAGIYAVDDTLIITDETGKLLTGWQEIGDEKFFVDSETYTVRCGLFEEEGAWYYGTDEGLATGALEIDGDWMPFGDDGKLIFGWFYMEDRKYYLDPSTKRLCRNSFFQIEDKIYYFDADGVSVSGLKTIGGALYGFGKGGERLTGLQSLDGGATYYYFDPEKGYACTGLREVRGNMIRLGKDGKQIFGWQEIDGEMYYTDPYTGYVVTGQAEIDGRTYQFDAEGRMIPDARLYNQKDQQWEMVQFNERSDSTMKASACGIFSFCNAIYALNGRKADAVEVAYWAIDVGAFRPGYDGTTRKIFYDNVEQQYGETLNFTLGGQYWGSISDPLLQSHLQSGGVAVIHVKGHFMAVTGYDQRTGLYHILESYESNTRGLAGDSWVDAYKMSEGNTNVDWYVLISKRYDDGSEAPSSTAPPQSEPKPDPEFPELFD
ncbi:MAG: hypothetical protein K6F80_07390 [Oscillospiraceae bacterium]|nr:hypothetical protein [Oscillospiraceae bacterium]